jgi:TPR repeat protein
MALALSVGISAARAQFNDGKPCEGIETLKRQAASGDAKAQFKLAGCFLAGAHVTQSADEALAWLHKAAEQGEAASQYLLGELYEEGGMRLTAVKQPDGSYQGEPSIASSAIPKNYTEAAKWYRRAAAQGIALAQNRLGTLYANGTGLPQDYSQAYFWLNVGEAGGSVSTTDGIDDRDRAASRLTKTALIQVQTRARKWLESHPTKPSPFN